MNRKGLVLLSGGLDSILAAKILLEQGVELEAVNFKTSFNSSSRKCQKSISQKASDQLGISLGTVDITTEEYLDVIKNPEHGYGSSMNPCVDCRIFMFKKAKEYMEKIGASFIVTGEVLGERPMSQRSDMIRHIEKESGLKGLIVRPLSAKLLESSAAEAEGVVDRSRLFDIRGKSRKQQIELAKRLGIADYPNPSGGCLLTEKGFAKKVRDLLDHDALSMENIELLKLGRHFRLTPQAKFVIGRDSKENECLLEMGQKGDIFFDAKGIPGPIGLLRGIGITQDMTKSCCEIVLKYSDTEGPENTVVYWTHPVGGKNEIAAEPANEAILTKRRI